MTSNQGNSKGQQPVGEVSCRVTCLDADDSLPDPQVFYETYVKRREPVLFRLQCAKILDCPALLSTLTIPTLRSIAIAVEASNATKADAGNQPKGIVEVNTRQKVPTTFRQGESDETEGSTTKAPSLDTTPAPSSFSFSPTHGSRVHEMRFVDFLDHLSSPQGSSQEKDGTIEKGANDDDDDDDDVPSFYMTTQTLPLDDEGRPAVTTWLANELIFAQKLLPLRPNILGHLIPMNAANLWMGRATTVAAATAAAPSSKTSTNGSGQVLPTSTSSSSGLHHDFHDNLYCLIRGSKSIRLAPPSVIQSMQMVGTVHTVHPNGRIVYKEQMGAALAAAPQSGSESTSSLTGTNDCPIRPDGALLTVERILQLELRKEAVEQKLDTLTSDNDDHKGNKEERNRLEAELDEIEEQLLDIEMVNNGDDEDDEDDDEDDQDDDSETGVFFGVDAGDDNDDDGNVADNHSKLSSADRTKRIKLSHETSATQDDMPQSQSANGTDNVTSRVDVPPNFVAAIKDPVDFQVVEMQEGDALYLPAGWFHEVFSRGSGNGTESNIHVAVNYWCHPPDVDQDVCFSRPYLSQFWQRDWDARNLEQATTIDPKS